MSKKRIILVEDEPDMAELVAARLRREGYVVETAGDGWQGLDAIRAAAPDLVLLDLMLPGLPGLELAKQMRADVRTAAVPIIMLTAKSEEADIVVGLHLGADDYITKPFSMSVLLARVAAALRRGAMPAGGPGPLICGPIRIEQDTHTVKVNGRRVALTATEYRLLVALASARGRVLTRKQLLDQTLGPDAVVTDRTVDVHLAALRRKLGAARACIRTVRGTGYRLVQEEPGAP